MYRETFETEVKQQAPIPDSFIYDHGIAVVGAITNEQQIHNYGHIQSRDVLMQDGSAYRVHEGLPKHSKIKLPFASLKTTAFLTKDDRGFNRHHQIKEVEAGIPTILISRELSWEKPLSQARTTHNMLKISKFILEQNDSLDSNNIQARGISRGGMLAINATAMTQNNPEYGMNFFYFSATAPCFPRPLKLSTEYLKMPLSEGGSLLYHISKMPLNTLLHYPKTIDANPSFALQDALTLINGDTGKFAKQLKPEKTHGYILVFSEDIMSMGKVWQEDFKHFKDVKVDIDSNNISNLYNGHLRVISRQDMSNAIKRQLRLAEEYNNSGGNLESIDYHYVNNGT